MSCDFEVYESLSFGVRVARMFWWFIIWVSSASRFHGTIQMVVLIVLNNVLLTLSELNLGTLTIFHWMMYMCLNWFNLTWEQLGIIFSLVTPVLARHVSFALVTCGWCTIFYSNAITRYIRYYLIWTYFIVYTTQKVHIYFSCLGLWSTQVDAKSRLFIETRLWIYAGGSVTTGLRPSVKRAAILSLWSDSWLPKSCYFKSQHR